MVVPAQQPWVRTGTGISVVVFIYTSSSRLPIHGDYPSQLGIPMPDSSIKQRWSSVLNPETWRSVWESSWDSPNIAKQHLKKQLSLDWGMGCACPLSVPYLIWEIIYTLRAGDIQETANSWTTQTHKMHTFSLRFWCEEILGMNKMFLFFWNHTQTIAFSL